MAIDRDLWAELPRQVIFHEHTSRAAVRTARALFDATVGEYFFLLRQHPKEVFTGFAVRNGAVSEAPWDRNAAGVRDPQD